MHCRADASSAVMHVPYAGHAVPCSWLHFDDDKVAKVSQQQVLSSRPYLLFYQRF